ncbi:outer membrane beta-barrel protein [Bradyrhizobium sp. CCGUVB23]|uniref:outer membrane beta-barrel protein n=1 Tax=Bradyrhizobium sp. CCGUVB23 TaxID=2949630 RepID=UPI0020B393FB|nr:outer membrane beta-barrel protein [Bradyrhizobium sp. CCGUVB23]MCP3463088.1 outer membrane beta-barrel protein [Bradyrhizobium sp. CCGUVB23]
MRSGVLLSGATTIALVATGAANAADLVPVVKLPAAVWSWSGGYIGGHVGGGYGRTSFRNPYGPSIYGGAVDTPVFLAGGQIGYNWQNNGWVFGVELDASGAVSDGTNTCLAPSGFLVSANCKAGPNVFATGTGRVGYAFGALGHTLAYLKGGVAWQNNRGDIVNNFEGLAPQQKTHFDYGRLGGIIGLGVEQALTPAWSVKVEYNYLHFGGPSVATPPTVQNPPFAILPANTTGLSSNYHIGKIGLNYHFGADPWTQWSDAPLYAKAPAVAPPMAYAAGWSFEGGSRLWLSRGRFQWNFGAVPVEIATVDPNILVSRLTYHRLDGLSGEAFGRVDSPWGVFLKGNIGLGRFNKGNINDEDWSLGPLSYVNNISGQANGRFTYYTADAGYDFLRGANYKVGGFIGWTYYEQSSDSIGCMQIANPNYTCPARADTIIGSQNTQWNAPRVGLSAETMLTERWRLSADVAYLPWTDFKGRDNHLLRPTTTFIEQRGNGGGGIQIEGVLSYLITKNFSVGVGGRYWAMWTKKFGEATCTGCDGPGIIAGTQFSKFGMERWGTFFQASYRFD